MLLSILWYIITLSTQCVVAMLWSVVQLRRGWLPMVVYNYSGQLLMMAHHTHMLHCFDYILHSLLVERLVMLMMAHHTHMLHCFDYILHSSLVERLVMLMMAHHTHMLHCFDYILHSSLVERLVMRSFSSDLLNVMCCRSMCIHACTQCHAHMPVYCVCHGAQSSANYNPCTNMRKM